MSIFIPTNDTKESYTKDESNRKFERRDPDIVKVPVGTTGQVIVSNGTDWKSGSVPSGLPSGSTRGNFLFWDEKKSSFQVGGVTSVSLGSGAGILQSNDSINVGITNCPGQQDGVIVGSACCYNNGIGTQGNASICIGFACCAEGNQGVNAISIGNQAARNGQGNRSISIGVAAGHNGDFPTPEGQIHFSAVNLITPKTRANAFYVEPIRSASTGNPLLYNTSDGEIVVNTSSQRYKKNIQDLPDLISYQIYNMRPKIFDRIDGEVTNEYGLIAEQVYDIDPNLVVLNRDQEPDGISWFRIFPLMIQEMKKLRDRIDVLETNQLPEGSPVLDRS